MSDDLSLLRQYAGSGDAEALTTVIKRYQNLVYGACLRVHGNPHSAQDSAQECFLELIKNAGAVRSSLGGWLHRCATHVSLKAIRGREARSDREKTYAQMTTGGNQDIKWEDVSSRVDEALDGLPDELRHAIIEHFLRQRSQAEIAEELGVSPATISRRVDKGLKELREKLKKAGVVASAAVLATLLSQNAASAAPTALMATLGKMVIAGVGHAGSAAPAAAGIASAKLYVLLAAGIAVAAGGVVVVKSTDRKANPGQPVAQAVQSFEPVVVAEGDEKEQTGDEGRAEAADNDPFGGKKITFDFVETPLTEAMAVVREKTGVNIVIDEGALRDLPEDRRVTLKVTDIKASRALDWICNSVELGWVKHRDGSVLLTSRKRAMQLEGVTRVYDVADLMKPPKNPKVYTPVTRESLMKFITHTIAPGTWGEETLTSVKCENGKLTVVHVEKVHGKVRELLDAFHQTVTMRRAGIKLRHRNTPPPEDPRKKKLAGKKTTFNSEGIPLSDLVAFLRETTEVNIILDQETVPPDLQATLMVYDTALSEALDKICSMCRLEYLVRDDGSVLITTPEQALQLQDKFLKLYNIEYLLDEPPSRLQNHPKGTGEALVDLIKQTVSPGTWGEQYHTSIQYRNGRLIVSHVSETHFQVLKLLYGLRRSKNAKTTE